MNHVRQMRMMQGGYKYSLCKILNILKKKEKKKKRNEE